MEKTEKQENSGKRMSVAALVEAVDRIVVEEEQQVRQIKEMEQIAMSEANDCRREKLSELKTEIDSEARRLRQNTPELISDAETALIYHYGGMIAENPQWSERLVSLESRIKQAAQGANVVPVLLRHPIRYQDDWADPGSTEVRDCLVLVPAEYADSEAGSQLFISRFASDQTHEHAFTTTQIPVDRSAISLRGGYATIYGGIFADPGADDTGSDVEISRYCLRTDGHSGFSMGEYSYSDSMTSILHDADGHAATDEVRMYKSCVGWDEIGTFIKRSLDGRSLERAVINLYEVLSDLDFTDFTGIRSPLVTIFRRIQATRKQVQTLENSVKKGLQDL